MEERITIRWMKWYDAMYNQKAKTKTKTNGGFFWEGFRAGGLTVIVGRRFHVPHIGGMGSEYRVTMSDVDMNACHIENEDTGYSS